MSKTQTYKDRLKALKAKPKKSLGQNFLINDEALLRIHAWAKKQNIQSVFEIGPGLGALTDGLRKEYNNLTLIELDKNFSEFWRNENLKVLEEDALRANWETLLTENQNLLVSNLPYQISASLVIELSQLEQSFNAMVLMFQKEVAQRITAEPDTKDYGILSIVAQIFWTHEKVMDLSPGDFYPAPKVASCILGFKTTSFKGVKPRPFVGFIKYCFSQRRKVLLKRLKNYASEAELLEVYKDLEINITARPENISPDEYIEIFNRLKIGDK